MGSRALVGGPVVCEHRILGNVAQASALEYSKKQIDKSGKVVRNFSIELNDRGDVVLGDVDEERLLGSMEVVDDFRAYHAKPLAKVNAGLRYHIRQAGMGEPDVTQRLKRWETIVDKLRREPNMALSKMEDIAGVRAILQNQRQARDVRVRLEKAKRWKIRRVRDYIDGGDPGPKSDGYRAIHIVVEKDGCYVEIQLRTPRQDNWAQSVEQDTRRLRQGLKFGSGPDDLREYYRLVSDLFAMHEQGIEPEQDFMEELARRYAATRDYFPERNGEG